MIWMAVTADEFELPPILESSAGNLAKKLGISINSVLTRERRRQNGKRTGYRIVKVEDD